MKTHKVITRARKALVMMVVAAFVVAFTAAPAYGLEIDGPRKSDSVMGLYDSSMIQDIIDALPDEGVVEDEPEPDIGDGGDWEPGPEQEIGDGGADEVCPDPQFPEGGDSEAPQGGQEETSTDTPQGGQEETPTVPQGGQEETPTETYEGGSLPFTGGNNTALAVVGLGVILGGIAMLALRRRDPSTDR